MTFKLNKEEEKVLVEAVKGAESKTSGEISVAIIKESSDYAFFELRFALIGGLLSLFIGLFFYDTINTLLGTLFWDVPPWYTLTFYICFTLLIGGLLYFIGNIPQIDRCIIPKKVMEKEVRKRALAQFTQSGVYQTKDQTGILIFVSLLEQRIELIADKGITKVIEAREWDEIVSQMIEKIKLNQLTLALEQGILACGDLLEREFPIQENDENELSDAIVILEE